MFINHTHDKQLFVLPRGSAKTTVVNTALSVWLHCYKNSIYTLMLANTENDAIEFVNSVKIAFNNDYIKNTFGDLVQPRKRTVNQLELELDNNTKIKAYSSQTSVRGTRYASTDGIFRPTCVLADDYISENDILTDESKQKKYIRWQKDVEDAGDTRVIRNGEMVKSGTKFLVIGTPLATGDFIDSIKNDPTYKLFHRSVVNFDVDEYFKEHEYWQQFRNILFDNKRDDPLNDAKQYYLLNKPHMEFETIWDKYQCDDLAIEYFNKRLAFMQEKMCNVENIGDKWFESNRTLPQTKIEENTFTKTMLTVDPAGHKVKNINTADFYSFVVGSLSENGFKYVRKAQLRKYHNEYENYIKHVIELIKEFKDISHVYIEKNTFNGLDVEEIKSRINKDSELINRNITFINPMQRSNKDEKISTIVSDVNNGRIIFCEERTEQRFLSQVMDFAGQQFSLYDDAPDCLSEFANRIDDIKDNNKRIRSIDRRLLGI